MLDENIAIGRLREHFRVHDDGRPTPLLDEAELVAYKALSNQYWLRNMLIDYEKDPTATKSEALMNDLYKVFVWGWTDNKRM